MTDSLRTERRHSTTVSGYSGAGDRDCAPGAVASGYDPMIDRLAADFFDNSI